MRLRKVNEAKQVGTLYHVCTLEAFLKYILPTNTLSASGKYNNHLYGGNDYVSFTRDKRFVVSTTTIDKARVLVRLVVDGNKLSERYKIGPYNDFAYNLDTGVFDPSEDWSTDREKEEVVKGPIKNLSNYLKEIQFDICNLEENTINDLKKLSRKSNMGSVEMVYYHFIKGEGNYERLIKSSGIRNGESLKDAVELFERVKSNDVAPLLFSGDINEVKQAIEEGADLNAIYDEGYPLIYYALRSGSADILELLLNNGADINVTHDYDTFSMSVLNLAIISLVDKSGIDNIKVLIKHGADYNSPNGEGYTPLMIASEYGQTYIVKYLISLGVDVNYINKWNNNALTVAETKEIHNILVNAGATYPDESK